MNRRSLFGATIAGALSALFGKQAVEAAPEPHGKWIGYEDMPLLPGVEKVWIETGRFDANMTSFDHVYAVQYIPIDALGWKSCGKHWHLAWLDHWDEYNPSLPFTIDDDEILWVKAVYPDNLWLLASGHWGWKPGESVEDITRMFALPSPILY